MKPTLKIFILIGLSMVAVSLFLFYSIGPNWDYVLPRRAAKVFAIILTGGSIAFSTVIFQTITGNRILTPSIIGLDSLYLLIQTFIIFVFGSASFIAVNKQANFLLSVSLMVVFALLLYRFLFKGEGRNIYFLLLIGIVFGTLFGSLSTFMQVLIDPNEFMMVQDRMFASFNNVNIDLLWLSFTLLIGIGIYVSKFIKYLDVISLGKEHAINLGVPYDSIVQKLLIIIAVLVSISTALVGPITFLGLLVANITYEFMKTYRHHYILIASTFISILALVGGQFIVERVFTFSTTLSVIINFVGGVYFIYLLLRESKSWSK
jgi:iron complex transport system permease protein